MRPKWPLYPHWLLFRHINQSLFCKHHIILALFCPVLHRTNNTSVFKTEKTFHTLFYFLNREKETDGRIHWRRDCKTNNDTKRDSDSEAKTNGFSFQESLCVLREQPGKESELSSGSYSAWQWTGNKFMFFVLCF